MADLLDKPQISAGRQRLRDAQRHHPEHAEAFGRLTTHVRQLGKVAADGWSPSDVMDLLKEGARGARRSDARCRRRGQRLRADAGHGGGARAGATARAHAESAARDFRVAGVLHALFDLLSPRRRAAGDAQADAKPLLRGKVRVDLLNRQVQDAVAEAARRAVEKRAGGSAMSGPSLLQMARVLKLRRKKKKSRAAAAQEPSEAVEVTRAEADELAALALEVMRALREEFAPRWRPEQQPWFVNAADNEVYSIVLGAVPKELFEQTQAFAAMQSLRAQGGVLQFHAGDRTSDALKRR